MDLDRIRVDGLVGDGPKGERPAPAEDIELSDAQIASLRDRDLSVAIVFHHLQTDWTKLQQSGLEGRFEELDIEVAGVYGSEFNAETQSGILEDLAETDIDAVVSIPVDTAATIKAYQTLADTGIELVFMDNVPDRLIHGKDYAGCVSSDNKGVGIIAGRFLREFGASKVGLITFDAPFYVTQQREAGVREVLDKSEDLEIVADRGFTNPYDVLDIAQEVAGANPSLDGLFVAWADPPAVQASEAVENIGRDDIVITTTGLSSRIVSIIAQDGPIKGTGSQFPYQQGIIEANMVGQALLGNETPPYIASGSLPVYKRNLREQYARHYQEELPAPLAE